MKEEYQERIVILKKKLNSDISRLEDNIKKTGARFRMHPRMILLFSSIRWEVQISKDILQAI